MKSIFLCAALALGAFAPAQVGRYSSTEGGYRIDMKIQPKGVWTFETFYLNRPNKKGGGRWVKKGKEIRFTLLANGKPVKGPDGTSIGTLSADGQTLVSRSGTRAFTFRKTK